MEVYEIVIINNRSGNFNRDIIIDKLGKDIHILQSEYYRYIWSFNKERNSKLQNSKYPQNYINAIHEYMNIHNDCILMIDIDNEEIPIFSENGIDIHMVLEVISDTDLKIFKYLGRISMLNLFQQKLMEKAIYEFYDSNFLKVNNTLWCKSSNRKRSDIKIPDPFIQNYNVFSVTENGDELILETQVLDGQYIKLNFKVYSDEDGVDRLLQILNFYCLY